jgi:hypothetical protein
MLSVEANWDGVDHWTSASASRIRIGEDDELSQLKDECDDAVPER